MVKLLPDMKPGGNALQFLPTTPAKQNMLLPLVEARLGDAIAALGLEVITSRCSELVFLENANCRVMLGWYKDDTLLCSFESKSGTGFWRGGSPMPSFDLYLFLYLHLGARVAEYLPRNWDGGGDRHLLCLDGIAAALVDGEMAGPLQGDFTWSEAYAGLVAEKDGMYRRLLAAMTLHGLQIGGICKKWTLGDPSWIGDARVLLAQVG